MNRGLVITSLAKFQIARAVEWYEKKQPELGKRFWKQAKQGLAEILENPEIHRPIGRGYRRLLLRKFPYAVYFLVRTDEILIVCVPHTSFSPARIRRMLAGEWAAPED